MGLDLQGNTYWEFRDTLNPGRMRRIVQYPRDLQYSEVTSKITPAWHQWLRHTRENPPSLTEQSQDLIRQSQLKVLAAQADARWNAKESFLDSPKMQQPQPTLGHMKGGAPETENHTQNYETLRGTAIEAGVNGNAPETTGQISRAQAQKMADTTMGKIGPLDRNPERMKVPEGPKAQVFTNPTVRSHPADEKQQPQVPPPMEDDPWTKAQKQAGGPSEGWQPKAWTPPAAVPRR